MSAIGELILKKLSRDPSAPDYPVEHYEVRHRDLGAMVRSLEDFFPSIREDLPGKKVLDIGCSEGMESVAIATLGAAETVGIDIRIDLDEAHGLRDELCPGCRIDFAMMDATRLEFPDESFDAVVTCSSLEHFLDPFAVLQEAKRVLRPGGRIFLTSGVWSGPWGAHMTHFTKVPWVQFLFSERTIMSVRGLYRSDGAERYSEVEGGLNDIGVRSFRKHVKRLDLEIDYLRLMPLRGLTFLTRIPLLGEFFTHNIYAILRR